MAITRVNTVSITGRAAAASATATIPAGTGIKAGDLIFVCAASSGTHVLNGQTCKDSVNGVNFTQLLEKQSGGGSAFYQQTFYFQTPQAIADGSTITLTGFASATACALAVDIFRGAVPVIDQAATGTTNATSTTPAGPALGAPAAAGSLVLATCITGATGTTQAAGSPFTAGSTQALSPGTGIGFLLAAPGGSTEGSTWTLGVTSVSSTETVSFQAAGAGAEPGTPYAPGWHPGAGLPGLPGGVPFWAPPSAVAPSPVPITVVQAAPTVQASSNTATVTLGSPTTAGNTLVACITGDNSTTNPVVTGITLGGAADHWQAAATDPGTVAVAATIWYDPNCAGGQTSVVVTATSTGLGPELYVAVYEVSGVLAADQHSNGDAGSAATTWSSGATATTTSANEIFFGACTATSAIPAVTGAGTWTTQTNGAGSLDQVAGYQIVSAVGTATFSGTIPSGGYSAIVATFSAGVSQATANLAAAGAVAALVTQDAGISTALAGAAAVAAVVKELPATMGLAGAGTVTDVVTQAVVASPAGAGAVTAVATQIVTANLAGAGAVTAKTVQAVTASPAGAGAVAAVVTQAVTGSLAGAGAVNASAGGTTTGTATIAAASAVTAAAAQGTFAAAAGAGAVTAKTVQAVTAAPAGAASVAALTAQGASAPLTAAGAVAATGTAQLAFTIGALTAVTAATATQAPADKGASGLTASTSPQSAITATDQRTGGPG